MKRFILVLGMILMPVLSNGLYAAENIVADSDSVSCQEKKELAMLKMEQDHEIKLRDISIDKMQNVLIPIFAIFFLFGVPFIFLFLILFFALRYKLKLQQERYAIVEKSIELGRELPDSFFEESSSNKKRLGRAITLITLGIGILFLGIIAENKYVWAISVIPMLIGLGQLLVYKIEKNARIKESSKERQNINEQE